MGGESLQRGKGTPPKVLTPATTTRAAQIVMITGLLCKLNLHHHWHVEHTEDGGVYKRCLYCGRDGGGGDGVTNGWALRRWW